MKRDEDKSREELIEELKMLRAQLPEAATKLGPDSEKEDGFYWYLDFQDLLLTHAPVAIAVLDREMKYLAHSRRWLKDFGLRGESLIGRYHYEVIPETPEKWKISHIQALAGKSLEFEQEPLRREDGSIDWVKRQIHPWRDADGNIGGVVLFSEVITGRKLTEDALERSEEKNRSIIENIQEGYFEVDLNGDMVLFNERLCEMFRYTPDEMKGLNNKSYVSDETAGEMQKVFTRIYETGEPITLNDYEFIRNDGSVGIFEISSSLIRNGDDKGTGFRGIVRDVTGQRRAESERDALVSQLQHAQRLEAIGTLAGGIAHDFNNLLMGIQGNISLMLINSDKTHKNYKKLLRVEEQVKRGSELTKQLLGFASVEHNAPRPVKVNEVIESSSYMFARTKKEIRIHKALSDNIWNVFIDQGQLAQSLVHLYLNAWQAMQSGRGDILIETENVCLDSKFVKPFKAFPGEYVRISVADNGCGMDEKTRKRIFEPFFTTREMGRGSGLGLASVFGVIRNHQGFINVKSEISEGTTIEVFLPRSKSVKQIEPVVRNEKLSEQRSVLLVDDNDQVVEICGSLLEEMGCMVYKARNGNEALELCRANIVDLALIDYLLPDMSGREVAEGLKEIDNNSRILYMSGYSIEDITGEDFLEKGTFYIQKPFSGSQLREKLELILDSGKALKR